MTTALATAEIVDLSTDSSALEALNRSEIDQQIATAHQYPRNVRTAIDSAMTMATVTQETAESMTYALPRKGKTISGPSVRLAEVMAVCWGNLRVEASVVSIYKEQVVARGVCHDLQSNLAISIQETRRITDRNGNRYNADMIAVTCKAACAIALREAIFKVVPRAFVEQVYHEAMTVALGKAESTAARRDRALAYFTGTLGVTEDRVLNALGRQSAEEVTTDDLVKLTGFKTAIKEGDRSIEQVFPAVGQEDDSGKSRSDKLVEKIKGKEKASPKKVKVAADPAPPEDPPGQTKDDLAKKAIAAMALTHNLTKGVAEESLMLHAWREYNSELNALADLTAEQLIEMAKLAKAKKIDVAQTA